MTRQVVVPLSPELAELLDGDALARAAFDGVELERAANDKVWRGIFADLKADFVDAMQAFVNMDDPGANPKGVRELHHRMRGAQLTAKSVADRIEKAYADEELLRQRDADEHQSPPVDERGGSVRDNAPPLND